MDNSLQRDPVAILAAPIGASEAAHLGHRQTRVTENSNASLGHVRSKIGGGYSGYLHFVSRLHRCLLFFAQFDKDAIAGILHKKKVVAGIEVGHHGAQMNRVCALRGAQRQLVYRECGGQRASRRGQLVPVGDHDVVDWYRPVQHWTPVLPAQKARHVQHADVRVEGELSNPNGDLPGLVHDRHTAPGRHVRYPPNAHPVRR